MIVHNLLGFNMFFFFEKSYRATAWCTKEIKFIDTLKYYQKSLADLFCKATDKTIFKFSPLFS